VNAAHAGLSSLADGVCFGLSNFTAHSPEDSNATDGPDLRA